MSAVAFIKGMIDAGFTCEQALRAAEVFETTAAAMKPVRSKGAARQARYEERKRQKASENVSPDASDNNDASDAPLSLPPPPQTPPPPTHTPGNETTHAHVRADPVLAVVSVSDWPDATGGNLASRLCEEVASHRLDWSKTPDLLTTSTRLAAWRRDGASWEFDVVPVVTALARRSGRPITSWKFFDAAIAQSIADNRQALTIPEARHASQAHDQLPPAVDARRANRERSTAGAERALEVMAARRNF